MLMRYLFACVLGAVALASNPIFGQSYPNKLIRVVTSAPGAGSDFVSRLIAQGISEPLGQPVIVDNRAGAVVAAEIVSKAQPDGHTLIYYGNSFWLLPLMRKDVPYDVLRDFAPITLTNIQPNILIVHPALPVRSVKDLIALAKARPGDLNYGSANSGSANHLAAELFKSMAKVNIVRIPYKGGGLALNALIAGEVHLMFATAASAIPFLKSGRLKALAVTTAASSALVPGLPAIADSGVRGYEAAQVSGMFAPAKTPTAVINRLNLEIVRFLNRPDIRQKLFDTGIEVVANSPEAFTAHIKSETAMMGKVIRDSNILEE